MLWLYAWQPGRVFKKLNARRSENFLEFLQNPFSNHLKVFHLYLELPSDQENKNDFADERLRFLGHRIASTLFTIRYIMLENLSTING